MYIPDLDLVLIYCILMSDIPIEGYLYSLAILLKVQQEKELNTKKG